MLYLFFLLCFRFPIISIFFISHYIIFDKIPKYSYLLLLFKSLPHTSFSYFFQFLYFLSFFPTFRILSFLPLYLLIKDNLLPRLLLLLLSIRTRICNLSSIVLLITISVVFLLFFFNVSANLSSSILASTNQPITVCPFVYSSFVSELFRTGAILASKLNQLKFINIFNSNCQLLKLE